MKTRDSSKEEAVRDRGLIGWLNPKSITIGIIILLVFLALYVWALIHIPVITIAVSVLIGILTAVAWIASGHWRHDETDIENKGPSK